MPLVKAKFVKLDKPLSLNDPSNQLNRFRAGR